MHGAGVIAGIEKCEVLGEGRSYYVLQMPLGDMKVMIPADRADHIGLRDVIPEERVEEVRDVLEDEPDRLLGTWNRRYQTSLERLKSGDICDAAAVTRNLVVQERERRISAGERRLLDLARQIVVSELVYACDKTPDEVAGWLDAILAANNA